MKVGKKTLAVMLACLLVFAFMGQLAAAASDDANFFDDLYPDITEGEPGEDEEIVTDEDVSFMEVLRAVGIMEGDTDGDLHPFRKITRAEMAAVLLRLQNISAAPAKNGQQAFYDVSPGDWFYDAVMTAKQLGIVNGYPDGNFLPDEPVGYNEAIKMVVEAIGYGPVAVIKGGYPLGHYNVANSLRVLEGAKKDTDDATLRKTAGRLIYNALFVSAIDISAIGQDKYGENVSYVASDETIGYRCFGLVRFKGTLELDGEDVILSGRKFTTSVPEIKTHVGAMVVADALEVGKDEFNIIHYELDGKNKVAEHSLSDIEVAGEKIVYIDPETGKETTYKISGDAQLVYNGEVVRPFDLSMAKPSYIHPATGQKLFYTGTISFVDNNGDRKMDYINVEAARTYLVGKASVVKKEFSDYYDTKQKISNPVSLDENKLGGTLTILTQQGKTATVSDFKEMTVASVFESKSGTDRSLKIMLYSKKINGKVTKINKDTVYIGDVGYKISDYYKNAQKYCPDYAPSFKIGMTVALCVDGLGEIYGVKAQEAGSYGYMMSYGKNGDSYSVKLADETGAVKVYDFAETVKIGTERQDASSVERYMKETYNVKNAPVRFSLNKDNQVSALSVMELYNPQDVTYQKDSRQFKPGANCAAAFKGKSVTIDDATVILGIGFGAPGSELLWPEDGNAPIDDSYTYKLNQSFFRRPFEVYDLKSYSDLVYFAGYDEATGTCDMVIVDTLVNTQFEDNVLPVDDSFYRTVRYPGSTMNAKETWMDQFTPYSPTDKAMDSLFLVNQAESELDENDNLVYTISGMQGGSTASYTFAANARMLTMRADYVGESDHYSSLGAPVQWSAARAAGEEYNFSDAAAAEGKKITFPQRFQTTELPEILPGDMAYITLDSSNKVSSFIYIGNCNEIPDHELHYRPKMHGMYIGVCFEPVFFLDDNYIGMVGNKNYVTDRQQLTGQPVYYWDFADQEFKKASVSDLYVSTDDISSAGYANNLWVAANRKNWQITEMVMVDYNLIGQKK